MLLLVHMGLLRMECMWAKPVLISLIAQLRHPRFQQRPLQQIGHLQYLCPALHIGHIESRSLHFEHPQDIIPLASGYFPTHPVPF